MELKQLKEEMATMKIEERYGGAAILEARGKPSYSDHPKFLCYKSDHIDGSFLTQKAIYKGLQKRKAKIEEQLLQISQSLSGMELVQSKRGVDGGKARRRV